MIRDCAAGDVPLLERAMPTNGMRVHDALFAEQGAGRLTYLVAWQDEAAVGVCAVNWSGSREENVRAALAACPEISNLHVAEAHRGRGTGTALVRASEARVRERGLTRVAIGVADDNPDAARLYLRLGYVDTGLRWTARYDYTDETGTLRRMVEPTLMLVKGLASPSPPERLP